MPGSFITITARTQPWSVEPSYYWRANRVMEAAKQTPFTGTFEQAVDRLDELLTRAVTERMVADVDLGALLSGGIDSSTVVGLMQRHSDRPVKTFSIGFEEEKYNEAEYASAVARHLGTEHEELYVTPGDCLNVVDRLPGIYDEPFGDISQVPTFLVSQMASRRVKVVLSGDGGDETFAGYHHYPAGLAAWRRLNRLPQSLRVFAADFLSGTGDRCWHLLKPENPALVGKLPGWRKLGSKLPRRTRYWRSASPQELLANHFARTHRPGSVVPGAAAVASSMTDPDGWAVGVGVGVLPAMLQFDYSGYLAGDILVKVDRAAMAVGLEVRSPILDTAVTEFAWTLPDSFLLSGGVGKRILRQVLARYVPTALTDRPKRGFGVPIDDWLRGALRDRIEDLISVRKLEDSGCFDAQAVRRMWDQHLCGWRNHSNILWSIMMFQEWYSQQKH
jgi:asparagine synthase (glutamine-hydrolysing)